MEIILMVGIAGSGKSTLARTVFPYHARISLDSVRKWCPARQQKILGRHPKFPDDALDKARKIEHVLVTEALNEGRNIVIDDTNLTRKIRSRHVILGQKYGATINAVFFQNISKAYERNKSRAVSLPDGALARHHRELEPPHEDEGFEFIQIMK